MKRGRLINGRSRVGTGAQKGALRAGAVHHVEFSGQQRERGMPAAAQMPARRATPRILRAR
jgi:hypothetical protein